jgi:hypothetical protein
MHARAPVAYSIASPSCCPASWLILQLLAAVGVRIRPVPYDQAPISPVPYDEPVSVVLSVPTVNVYPPNDWTSSARCGRGQGEDSESGEGDARESGHRSVSLGVCRAVLRGGSSAFCRGKGRPIPKGPVEPVPSGNASTRADRTSRG